MKHLSWFLCACRLAAFLSILFSGTSVFAQAPGWQAVAAASGSIVRASATDASGNVYITGGFMGTTRFGTTTLTSQAGAYDVFVAKWSPVSGDFVWAQQGGGSDHDIAFAIAVNGTSVYITGSFMGPTASFGNSTLINASNATYTDVFVAKLTDVGTTGSFSWARRAGGISSDNGTCIAVHGTSVYVGGNFVGPADFGTSSLVNNGISSTAFVTKITDLGASASFTWVQQTGGPGEESISGLAANGTNIYVTGGFSSATASFGTTVLTNASTNFTRDIFVAKLADMGTSGSFVWAVRAGSANDEHPTALAVQGIHIYVAGAFTAQATIGTTILTGGGAFVTRLTDTGSTGIFNWAKQAGNAEAQAVTVKGANVYVAGYFTRTASLGTINLTSAGNSDVFVARLMDMGTSSSFTWGQRAGGAREDMAWTVTTSGPNVYVAGDIAPPASFGSHTVTVL
jgi:hypothetical protein